MKPELTIQLMDTHAGGDVSRIVTGGIKNLPGDTVRAQMEYLRDDADGLRRLLLEEPYGIPEMSVDLLVPATNPKPPPVTSSWKSWDTPSTPGPTPSAPPPPYWKPA